jgi:hypothetical protein
MFAWNGIDLHTQDFIHDPGPHVNGDSFKIACVRMAQAIDRWAGYRSSANRPADTYVVSHVEVFESLLLNGNSRFQRLPRVNPPWLAYQTYDRDSVLLRWHCIPLAFYNQPVHKTRSQNVLPETLLLQQLKCTERWPRVTA